MIIYRMVIWAERIELTLATQPGLCVYQWGNKNLPNRMPRGSSGIDAGKEGDLQNGSVGSCLDQNKNL